MDERMDESPINVLAARGHNGPELAWVAAQPGADWQTLWERCHNGDWMIRMLAPLESLSRSVRQRIAARCACLATVSAVAKLELVGHDAGALRAAALAALETPSDATLVALWMALRDASNDDYTHRATYLARTAAMHAAEGDASYVAHLIDEEGDGVRRRPVSADLVRAVLPVCPRVAL